MKKIHKIAIFEGQKIRRHWDEDKELWYFSVVDVVGVLSASENPRNYWKVLKNRLKQEGSEVVTKCNQLKMQASDGKYYLTDVADTEVMLRLIQSVPSKNAEPFKLWLARVGYERLEETADPELAINRALKTYKREPKDFDGNKSIAREGGSVAGNARREIESKTGKKIITKQNAKVLHTRKEIKKLKLFS